jgi:hypothetical protein
MELFSTGIQIMSFFRHFLSFPSGAVFLGPSILMKKLFVFITFIAIEYFSGTNKKHKIRFVCREKTDYHVGYILQEN